MLLLFQLKKTIQLMTCFSNQQQNNTSLSLYSSNQPLRMGGFWKLHTTCVLEVMHDTPCSSSKNLTVGKYKFWLSYQVIDVLVVFFELPN